MIIFLLLTCLVQCLVLVARLRLIEYERLDAFGIRVELAAWIMFMMIAGCKPSILAEPILVLFLSVICAARIISGSSFILGHPHKVATFSVGKRPRLKK